jgi:uncharacterized spore protein YtfJ
METATNSELNESNALKPLETIQETLDKFIQTANVDKVYGRPVKQGDTVILPTAEVLCGMGFGIGSGVGHFEQDEEEGLQESDTPSVAGVGSGGGGGGRTLSRPVAVIIASPEGVRIEPVIDSTKIAMAALTAAGFVFGMFLRMRNYPKSEN